MTQALVQPVLNPDVTFNFVDQYTSDQRWNLLWKVTAVAAIVTTVAVAFFAAVSTSLFYAAHIAFGALIASALIKSHVWDRSLPYANSAEFNSKIAQRMQKLDELVGPEIESLGIKPGAEPAELKSILAYYQYNKEKQTILAQKIKEHLDLSTATINIGQAPEVKVGKFSCEHLRWADANDLDLAMKIQGIHLARNKLVREAAVYNLEAGYALKLMQEPYDTRSFSDYVECSPFNSVESFINKAIGDKGADIFARTKKKSYTAEELHTMDTMKLAHEVFELPKSSRGWW